MNQSINIAQIAGMLTTILKMLPSLVALLMAVKIARDEIRSWNKSGNAQTFAYFAAGLAALAYAGMKL